MAARLNGVTAALERRTSRHPSVQEQVHIASQARNYHALPSLERELSELELQMKALEEEQLRLLDRLRWRDKEK